MALQNIIRSEGVARQVKVLPRERERVVLCLFTCKTMPFHLPSEFRWRIICLKTLDRGGNAAPH